MLHHRVRGHYLSIIASCLQKAYKWKSSWSLTGEGFARHIFIRQMLQHRYILRRTKIRIAWSKNVVRLSQPRNAVAVCYINSFFLPGSCIATNESDLTLVTISHSSSPQAVVRIGATYFQLFRLTFKWAYFESRFVLMQEWWQTVWWFCATEWRPRSVESASERQVWCVQDAFWNSKG